jgi:NodT family efflux transporter outer membrane factor (OMF) lipoprotein
MADLKVCATYNSLRYGIVVVLAMLGPACTLGPDYVRPSIETPATYRDVVAASATPTPASLADLEWFDLFKDEALRTLVNTALQQNFDLRMAAERVLQAREQFRIERSNQFPTVDGSAGATATRRSEIGATILPPGVDPEVASVRGGFSLNWELDVWGRLRRLSESARAQYLATEEGRRGVVTTLVADVTQAYLSLRALDMQLTIGRRTRDVAVDNLRLTELRRDRGVATTLDVRQAEQLLFTATGQIAAVERAVTQTENALSLLLGQAPGDVARGQAIDAFTVPPVVPAGLPSSLLERRPDIRQAEQELIAANAQIGAARAEYFPRISLTSMLGVESRALSDVLTARAGMWNVGASAVAPIFNAGRTRATVKLAESVQRELVINYQRSIYGALREVSDALAGYRKTSEQRGEQERLVAALRDATRLSTQRYQGGLDSYLPVLDAERSLFQSELDLAGLRRQELGAIVELYRALGGGWSTSPPTSP